MSEKRPNRTEATDGNLLHVAERHLESVLRELDAILDELQARKGGAEVKAKAASADVRKAIGIVFEERHRIEKLHGKNGTGGRGEGLDLDEARAEIGRRLARLRKHRGAGGVSGGAGG
ncbi:hypothetical protein GCM10011358_25610 [Sinisalibacter lacisalsi]|uniref:Uncharacterized protein n=2 Tax=Sinisalibacter lacisalsi TaxID=1526570 RepID=A0ABQ1QSW6_9RHOB|nr:hypothetical protein GCM10011358_25610 [Sinisalibacter lacisalsi]